jgi:hypothetical protein
MPNPKHLEILKQGVEVWNKWRAKNPDVTPKFHRSDFSNVNLASADFSNTEMISCIFDGCDLTSASFAYSLLFVCHFKAAKLRRASLFRAQLIGCHCEDATLVASDLQLARIDTTALAGANLGRATLDGTGFLRVDLSCVKGLDTITHFGRSSLDISSVYLSKGNISRKFLRGIGIPEEFITYISSLVGRPIEYYSCFISYSSKDERAATRLNDDLQAAGVRCWFAPEDLRVGDPFRQRIDESIRVHDKLLLILSSHSVSSAWVQDEVEAALERERREKRLVLFPIRIDNAVMDTDQAWAASIRRGRHIGDFTRWKDRDSYQQAFQRLLRDLKAEGGQDGK